MGYGNYSRSAHEAISKKRSGANAQEVFTQRECHPLMNPKGVVARECRDSADHPATTPIAFALDVTGSMGHIPHALATETLPSFMATLEECGVVDPQLLFAAVGDATSDRAPLQVGQFEATAELMDQWLTWSYLEGGGGAWGQESYELALYFLAAHTELDSVTKRSRRGYAFITGDEKPYPMLSRHIAESVLGDTLEDDVPTEAIVAELQRSFVPYFIIPSHSGQPQVERAWRDLLGDHVIVLEDPSDVCHAAAGAVALAEGVVPDVDGLAQKLRDAGTDHERIGRVARALRDMATPPPAVPEPSEPSLLKRLFGKK